LVAALIIQPDGPNQPRVAITPDFKGYYSLGNAQDIVNCQSKGALENDILAFAGPTRARVVRIATWCEPA